MYIADEENANDSFALHNYLDERDKYNDISMKLLQHIEKYE